MSHSFDLVDQPWIPCIRADGSFCELGLLAALTEAHRIREIFDDSPLVTVAIHRLLLAILHHNFGPADAQAWAELWNNGKGWFDAEVLHGYFNDPTRRTRFDLFSETRPFYQTAAVPFELTDPTANKPRCFSTSVAKLAAELAAGNNDTLFDHNVDARPPEVLPNEAARLVLAAQAFGPSGTITDTGTSGKISAKATLLYQGAVVLVRGANLFQTMMLNLVMYSEGDSSPFPFEHNNDLPAWDRDTEAQATARDVDGYLDLLTWQSRRIRLQTCDRADPPVVKTTVLMEGNSLPNGRYRRDYETMMAFIPKPNPKANEEPWTALGFKLERSFWRDCTVLFQSLGDDSENPRTLKWLHDLVQEGVLSRKNTLDMDLLGLQYHPKRVASILLWRHERMPLPLAYLDDVDLIGRLRVALRDAEEVGKALSQGSWHFARLLLLRDEKKQPSREQKKDIQNLLESLAPQRLYWSRLEVPFIAFLRALPGDEAPESSLEREHREHQINGWRQKLRRTANGVFEQIVKSEDTSARTLKAAAISTRRFRGMLKKALPETEVMSDTSN